MKRPVVDTGPLLPSEASTIITVVAGMIGLGGALTLIGLALVLLGPVFGGKAIAFSASTVFGVLLVGGFGFAYCLTGIWLHEGRRRGAYLAFGALALNVISLAMQAARPGLLDVLLPVAALVGVALAWPHLSEEGRELDAPVRVRRR